MTVTTRKHRELYSVSCNNTYISESLCCTPEMNTMLYINYSSKINSLIILRGKTVYSNM